MTKDYVMKFEDARKQNKEIAERLYSYLSDMVEETHREKRNRLRYKVHECIMSQLNKIRICGSDDEIKKIKLLVYDLCIIENSEIESINIF
jgi:hypothetical protein